MQVAMAGVDVLPRRQRFLVDGQDELDLHRERPDVADEAANGADVLSKHGLRSIQARAVLVLIASVGSIARPCANSASRLVLAKITAL
jgi:hypothetical protein